MASEIKVDTISEKTSANGVTIDSLSIKDGGLIAEGNIDVNGNNLVLDANANTYLDAGTDDTIKFYVAGAHDLTISANAINVLSGTTLTIDSGATIANSGTATGFSSADPASADGDTLGTASLEWSDLYLADSSVIYFGADQDTTLTHTDGTGLTLNSTNKLTFGDAASFIQQSSDGVLKIEGEATVDINATAAVTIAATGVPVTVGGIVLYRDANDSIYTHDVSGTQSTAEANTSYGVGALDAITTADGCVAIGNGALSGLTTGGSNIAIGKAASNAFDAETHNISIGLNALSGAVNGGEYNVCIGNYSLDALTSADNNVTVGYNTGTAITTGSDNVLLGSSAGEAITTGASNIMIGSSAGGAYDAEDSNIGIGTNALSGSINGGESNVAIGVNALPALTSADDTVAVGHAAGYLATTGDANTLIGYGAGDVITTSPANTMLGGYTDPSAHDSGGHEIAIGKNAVGKGVSTGFMNANGGANYAGNNSASWSTTSDRRIKKNIEDNNTGLDKLKQIQVRNFEYRLPEEVDPELPSHAAVKKKGIQLGVIAQEVMDILPDIVKQESTGCYTVDPDNITWYLVNAIQELSAQVTTLKDEINTLKGG